MKKFCDDLSSKKAGLPRRITPFNRPFNRSFNLSFNHFIDLLRPLIGHRTGHQTGHDLTAHDNMSKGAWV